MKMSQSLLTYHGTQNKQNKSKKESKKSSKKISKSLILSDSQKLEKSKVIETDNDVVVKNENRSSTVSKSVEAKNELKIQLEKRKQESNEWKALKKNDYQRLETVMEEGQLSSEETLLKFSCQQESNRSDLESESDNDQVKDFECTSNKIGKIYDLFSMEKQKFWKCDEESIRRKQQTCEKGDTAEEDLVNVGNEDQIKKIASEKSVSLKTNINFNGIMEILPIFSNDKFVCSRDAISIEEYEDLDALNKHNSSTVNNFKKEETTVQCDKRAVEKVGGSKDSSERKLRFKILTEKNLKQKTSSHFINSLLLLTPFAAEKEKLFKEKNMSNLKTFEDHTTSKDDNTLQIHRIQDSDEFLYDLKPFTVLICISIGLFSIFVALAWKSYTPPCAIDYLLEFIPFIQRRRTYIQLFFDELIKILTNVYGNSCKKFVNILSLRMCVCGCKNFK